MCNAEYIITVYCTLMYERLVSNIYLMFMSSFVPSTYIADLITFLDVLLMTSMSAMITMPQCSIVSGGAGSKTPVEYEMRLQEPFL